MRPQLFLLILALFLPVMAHSQAPNYKPLKLEPTTLSSVGSDSMDPLMNAWANRYKELQPNVTLTLTSGGSASAPAAIVEGTADLGPMARAMKKNELREVRGRLGFDPTQIRAALAPIGVYVSDKSSLKKLSLSQLDSIFSTTRKQGAQRQAIWWADLGVTGAEETRRIKPLALGETSPLQIYFRQQAMLQGEFLEGLEMVADANALFNAIEMNPDVIGFAELTTPRKGVRLVPVSFKDDSEPKMPTVQNLVTESYPLSRYVGVVVARAPFEEFEPAAKDFLSFILSREGQSIVRTQGLMALPSEILKTELSRLE